MIQPEMTALSSREMTDKLIAGQTLLPETLTLSLPGIAIRFSTNSLILLTELKQYFQPWISDTQPHPAIDVIAIEQPVLQLDVPWKEWKREPGKQGRKEAYCDLPDGRLIQKVRTGMVFLQNPTYRVAAGPCEKNPNQVINFINNQYMTALQQDDWVICHAAALNKGNRTIGFAGFSGGGKSTSMLHLLADPELAFLTNDRLFIKRDGSGVTARGVPKLPRINPGTIVNNTNLSSIISKRQRDNFLSMPKDELWQLEEKYDVDIAACFGEGKLAKEGHITDFIILNWSHRSDQATHIQSVSIKDRPQLLDAIMKSSGPFFQRKDGSFNNDSQRLNPESYIQALHGVNIVEVSGGVDFQILTDYCRNLLGEKSEETQ